MRFSAFTPLGLYRLSGRPAMAKQIYASMINGLGDQYNVEQGQHMEAFCFAAARGIARARRRLQLAIEQKEPTRVSDMLPIREAEYGLTPGQSATMGDRRRALAAAMEYLNVPTALDVEDRLTDAIGSDFVAQILTTATAATATPTNCGDQPMNLVSPNTPMKMIRILDPISILGVNTVSYEVVEQPNDPTEGDLDLVTGDKIVVEPEIEGISETVVVEVLSSSSLKATFTKPHSAGCIGTTWAWPCWRSNKRHTTIVTTIEAATDPEQRRQVDNTMTRIARACSTWGIVAESAPESGETLRFTIGSPSLGFTTVEPVIF